jgi:hypothetical protein
MLRAGQRNGGPPLLVAILFTGWVLIPFVALAWAHLAASRWPALLRTVLSWLTWLITAATLAIYARVALGPFRPPIAFYFVVVPPASVIVLVVALSIAAAMSQSRERVRGA